MLWRIIGGLLMAVGSLFACPTCSVAESLTYDYSSVTVIVCSADFHCPPCRRYESQEKLIQKKFAEVWFAHTKTKETDNPTNGKGMSLPKYYTVENVHLYPTFIVMKNDAEVYRMTGYGRRGKNELQQLIQWAAIEPEKEETTP